MMRTRTGKAPVLLLAVGCGLVILAAGVVQLLRIAAQDDPLDLVPLARDMIRLVDGGNGVLLLTDIFGATPSNLTMKLLEPGRVEGLAGVNLPMLLRALTYREKGMEIMMSRAVGGARDGVLNLLKDV